MLIVVINTDETIQDVLREQFKGCVIDNDNETVIIDGVEYYYSQSELIGNPIDELSVYELSLSLNV